MFKILCIVAALVAACSAAPASLYYQSSPLLAQYAPAPLAPASTAHATHVAAALAPAAFTYAAAGAPLAYAAAPAAYAAAPAAYAYPAPLAYDAGYAYTTYAAGSPLKYTY